MKVRTRFDQNIQILVFFFFLQQTNKYYYKACTTTFSATSPQEQATNFLTVNRGGLELGFLLAAGSGAALLVSFFG